jgi:hypothetical protein
MGNENSGWHGPENGGNHVSSKERIVELNHNGVKGKVVLEPITECKKRLQKEMKNGKTER